MVCDGRFELNSKQLILAAHLASEDKKGIDPLVLDIRKLTDIADFFLLVHGNSDRHVRTIADGIIDHLHAKKIKPVHVEGMKESNWILIDYGSVMIHVFYYQTRQFYNLERLWGDAKIVKTSEGNHERKVKSTRRSSAS